MGGVSRQSAAATFPPDRFFCLLDELPLHLIPQRDLKSLNLRDCRHDPLFLNPECVVLRDGRLPDEILSQAESLAGFAAQGFALKGTIAWVRDSVARNLIPFWLGPQLESLLCGLRLNRPVLPSLPADDAPGRP